VFHQRTQDFLLTVGLYWPFQRYFDLKWRILRRVHVSPNKHRLIVLADRQTSLLRISISCNWKVTNTVCMRKNIKTEIPLKISTTHFESFPWYTDDVFDRHRRVIKCQRASCQTQACVAVVKPMKLKLTKDRPNYSGSPKNPPPAVFWHFFPKRLEFLINFLHTYYTFISTLHCIFLFNYRHFWRCYAILSDTTHWIFDISLVLNL